MNTVRYVLLAINGVVWSTAVWNGWRDMSAIKSQHAVGYPNAAQFQYYVLFPAAVLVAAIILSLLIWRTRWANYGTGWLIFTLLLLLPYGCFYTGGV